MNVITRACACGQTALELEGAPILAAECLCRSCHEGAQILEARIPNLHLETDYHATAYTLYRKDRVTIKGAENLRQFRLKPDAPSRRVVASCCNTPMFFEFEKGHWLSIYSALWPEDERPAARLRVNAKYAHDPERVPDNIPNAKTVNLGFLRPVLGAWARMGFRNPKLEIYGEFDV